MANNPVASGIPFIVRAQKYLLFPKRISSLWTLSQYFQHRAAKLWFNGVVEVDIDVKRALDKIQAILDS